MATTENNDSRSNYDPIENLDRKERLVLSGSILGLSRKDLSKLIGISENSVSKYRALFQDKGFLDSPDRRGPKQYSPTSKSEGISPREEMEILLGERKTIQDLLSAKESNEDKGNIEIMEDKAKRYLKEKGETSYMDLAVEITNFVLEDERIEFEQHEAAMVRTGILLQENLRNSEGFEYNSQTDTYMCK